MKIKNYLSKIILIFITCFILAACQKPDMERANLEITPVSFNALPGWNQDSHEQVLGAFSKSCERILKKSPETVFGPQPIGGTYGDWQIVCNEVVRSIKAMPASQIDPKIAKAFFERYFQPYEASGKGVGTEGLFTGYYEATLNGSKTRHGVYQYPVYALPDDLVMVELGDFREDLKGRRIAGRVIDGKLRVYEDREDIGLGKLPDAQKKVIVWVDDAVDLFFLHIQGSGRVIMDDGTSMRIGYAGQNGHPYYAIGRELINRGDLTRETVSLQTIRAWLHDNPAQADDLMNKNPSYVFFRALDSDKGEGGPIGGEGLVLSAGRSLAIDRSKIPYGVPLWVDIAPPLDGEPGLRRLMVTQDTGGAIRGAVRADVFWGHGDRAEYLAGHMKSKGRYWFLLPKQTGIHE